MNVFDLPSIRAALDVEDALARIEAGFAAYSAGAVTVPPVGHLDLPDADGECHIKYGWLRGDDVYLVKIASGFYGNAALGLPSGNGLMLLFSARTGEPLAILLDEGHLTDLRTALAGAVCARHLAPAKVERIGIVGGGIQARLQLRYLAAVTACRDALVWTRRPESFAALAADLADTEFRITAAPSLEALCAESQLIVTTTPAREPLIRAAWIHPGTHLTCVGSDGGGKRELEAAVLGHADLCVVDSRAQCLAYGEAHYAVAAGLLGADAPVELGTLVAGEHPGRTDDAQITVADLTGVAVQDIAIARSVWERLRAAPGEPAGTP